MLPPHTLQLPTFFTIAYRLLTAIAFLSSIAYHLLTFIAHCFPTLLAHSSNIHCQPYAASTHVVPPIVFSIAYRLLTFIAFLSSIAYCLLPFIAHCFLILIACSSNMYCQPNAASTHVAATYCFHYCLSPSDSHCFPIIYCLSPSDIHCFSIIYCLLPSAIYCSLFSNTYCSFF